MLEALVRPLRTLAQAARNRDLRRLQLAWGAFYTSDWAFMVALAVYAYDRGGAVAVGLVGFIRMLPSAVAVPFGSLLADRYPRKRVIVGVELGRAAAACAAALAVLADAPTGVVFALAAALAVIAAPRRPAQWALTPAVARTPSELVAANAAAGSVEGLGILAGPAVAGAILAVGDVAAVFALAAVLSLGGAAAVARVGAGVEAVAAGRRVGLLRQVAAGFTTLATTPEPRLVISLFAAQTIVRGALNVLVVVVAIELLEVGRSGVGFLNSAIGAGGLIGAVAAFGLVGRRRLGPFVALGLVLWGAPIALIGGWPEVIPALVALALVGAGNSVLDVAGFTLVQRLVPDDVLARVFGVLETLVMATIALGAVLTPLLLEVAGDRGALLATGAFLPAVALLAWRRLRQLDEMADVPAEQLALLRGIDLFAPLPPATLEGLARGLEHHRFAEGTAFIREGEAGDRFYVLAAGTVRISAGGVEINVLGPGDYVGEIALLREVPRVATVTALEEVEAYSLERDEFVAAVGGHAASADTADATIGARLGMLRARVAG